MRWRTPSRRGRCSTPAEWAALKRICSGSVRQTGWRAATSTRSRLRSSPSGRGASPFSRSWPSFLAIIIVRSGLLEIQPALATFAGALAIAVIALLCRFAAFAVIWMEGLAGMGAALRRWRSRSCSSPIRPISASRPTGCPGSTTSPPIRSIRRATRRWRALRPRDANPVTYAGLYAAEQQRAAYPDIGPLGTNATPQAAYDAASR